MPIITLEFQQNHLLSALASPPYSWLDRLSHKLEIQISQRGNLVTLKGRTKPCQLAADYLKQLYNSAEQDKILVPDNMDFLFKKMQAGIPLNQASLSIGSKILHGANNAQMHYMNAMASHSITIGVGPAGTGKTHIAVGFAVKLFLEEQVQKIILSRPAVEAGERLGYLPGDMREKINPYFQPIYDSLHDFLGREKTEKLIATGQIEIAPLAFMRGRTLKNAFILLDEAQNSTQTQMKMFLTRLGNDSRMVINGDLSQIDLVQSQISGLEDAVLRLKTIKNIAICQFSIHDVVRHSLVTQILEAYETVLP